MMESCQVAMPFIHNSLTWAGNEWNNHMNENHSQFYRVEQSPRLASLQDFNEKPLALASANEILRKQDEIDVSLEDSVWQMYLPTSSISGDLRIETTTYISSIANGKHQFNIGFDNNIIKRKNEIFSQLFLISGVILPKHSWHHTQCTIVVLMHIAKKLDYCHAASSYLTRICCFVYVSYITFQPCTKLHGLRKE